MTEYLCGSSAVGLDLSTCSKHKPQVADSLLVPLNKFFGKSI